MLCRICNEDYNENILHDCSLIKSMKNKFNQVFLEIQGDYKDRIEDLKKDIDLVGERLEKIESNFSYTARVDYINEKNSEIEELKKENHRLINELAKTSQSNLDLRRELKETITKLNKIKLLLSGSQNVNGCCE